MDNVEEKIKYAHKTVSWIGRQIKELKKKKMPRLLFVKYLESLEAKLKFEDRILEEYV